MDTTNEISHGNLTVPPPAIQREAREKSDKSFFFWLSILVIVSVALAGGIIYRLWPKSKDKATALQKDVATAPKNTAADTNNAPAPSNNAVLKGILYSEDKPSSIIDGKIVKEGDIINGVKVVKINKDMVEFEKDGQTWTQRKK